MCNWHGSCTACGGGVRNTPCRRISSRGFWHVNRVAVRAHELYTSLHGYISCERLFRGLQLATLPVQEARQGCMAGIDCNLDMMSGTGYQTEGTCLEPIHRRPAGSECPKRRYTTRYLLISGMSILASGRRNARLSPVLAVGCSSGLQRIYTSQVLCDTSTIICSFTGCACSCRLLHVHFRWILTSMRLPLCW